MKGFLVLSAFIAAAAAAGGFTPGLRVRFDLDMFPGLTFFINVPQNIDAAKEAEWRVTRRPAGPLPQLVMYCPSDKVLCALYDDTGYVAGVQVGIAKLEFSDSIFDWAKQGFTSWNTTVDGAYKSFWTIQQYFVNEEFLEISKEERLASRNASRLLQADGVWLTGFDKQLLKVPHLQSDIEKEGDFTKHACIPLMGQHYYYNMTSKTECTADQILPWYPLTQNGELIATGFMTFGQLELQDGKTDWFERPAKVAVEAILPNGPDCLYELTERHGALTTHIYYIDIPWTIFCLGQP